MSNHNSYQLLLSRLEAFIKKHYKNLILKGLLLSFALIISLWLAISVVEYFGHLEIIVRSVLFYSFLGLTLFVLSFWVVVPLMRLYKIGSRLNEIDAAKIIGNHFPEINDKVINTLQLHENDLSNDLVLASIDQKSKEINNVSFLSVIDYKENKRYAKFLIFPVLFGLCVGIINSEILSLGSKRILNHRVHFEPTAPYLFVLQNESFSVIEGDSFELSLITKGSVKPKELFVVYNGETYRLSEKNGVYSYIFQSLSKNVDLYITDKEFHSKTYTIVVNPKPSFSELAVRLDYPGYTNKENEDIRNSGNLSIPEGTIIRWSIKAKHAKNVSFLFEDSTYQFDQSKISLNKQITTSQEYKLAIHNEFVLGDTSVFYIDVKKDAFPKINVTEEEDSIKPSLKYFTGEINDDYGFSKLEFVYIANDKQKHAFPVSFSRKSAEDLFFYEWNISSVGLEPGESISYYFEVSDNDAINGSKKSRSVVKTYKSPTLEELSENADKANKDIKNSLSEGLKDAKKLQEELKNIQENLLNKKNLNWDDKKQISDFLDQQKTLEKQLESLKKEAQKKNEQLNEFKKVDENLLKKQKQLEKLFDELMSDELKELYKELEELLNELNKDKLQENIDELDFKQEDIENQLDRTLELFKQLEFEEKLESITDRLDELSKQQEKLSEETKEKEKSNDELKEEQSQIDDKFKQVKDDLEALKKLNEELEKPKNIQETKEKEESIQEDINESKNQLDKNNSKKAAESQKNAGEQMQQLNQQLQQMQQEQQEQKTEEDINSLRMLLENLVKFSFDQEDVMNSFNNLPVSDPKYVEQSRKQQSLLNDSELIKDSLIALSKRIEQIETYVLKEINDINYNISGAIDFLSERKTSQASQKQQSVMMASNNLALLLDEVLQQLQKQASSNQPGTGQCEKPGGSGSSGSPSMKSLKEQLQKQLEKMKQDAAGKKGEKEGGEKGEGSKGKNGDKSGSGTGGSLGSPGGMGSMELAKMAAQQEAIRKEIQKLAQELNKDGSGSGNGLNKAAEELEKIEDDIINNRISNETLKRQEEVLTRLLEHEKAEREQEFDNKKEAEKVKNQKFSNPTKYLEYKKKKEKEIELLKTIPLDLNEYYKNKVNEYFKIIE